MSWDWSVATFHPAYIGREKRKFEGCVLKVDLARAFKLARREWQPSWDRSGYIIGPTFKTAKRVLAAMARSRGRVAFDIETDGRHPYLCTVRCVAFYDGKTAICIPYVFRTGEMTEVSELDKALGFKSRPVWKRWWSEAQEHEVNALIQQVFNNCKLETQNGQFDRLCLELRKGFKIPDANAPGNHDTILSHHIVTSYFPHSLNFIASTETEVPYYKTTDEGDAWSANCDEDLQSYACDDVVCTYTAATTLREDITVRKEDARLYEHDSWYEAQGQRWKRIGFRVDWRAVELLRKEYGEKQDRALVAQREVLQKQFDKASGKDAHLTELLKVLEDRLTKSRKRGTRGKDHDESDFDDEAADETAAIFNPASLAQLRLLLRHLGVPLTEQTATGDLSTKKDFLLTARKELISMPRSKKALLAIEFLDYLFAWRECAKMKSTYLYPECVRHGPGDIRVHGTFNFHVVPTGRLSGSNPNMTNQPAEMRGIFVADEDEYLVTGDWSALELRLNGLVTGDEALIKLFTDYDSGKGLKPHVINASILFQLPLTKDLEEKYPGQYRAAKVFIYAIGYGGGAKTIYEKVLEEMPEMKWDDFLVCFERIKKAYPTFFKNQHETVLLGTQQQHLDTPVLKRRVYYWERTFGDADSPEGTAMQNMRFQGGGADVVSLANRRMVERVLEPWRAKRLLGTEKLEQRVQVHDELLFGVPSRLAEEFVPLFKSVCEEEVVPGWKLPVDVKILKPKKPWAPSRWKPLYIPCVKCMKPVAVEYAEHGCLPDRTLWEGKCENSKCSSAGKTFTHEVAHGPEEVLT